MTGDQIRCLLSSAQTKSFTETASNLHFQPQTVSKQIRALEKELGVILFIRKSNRLELTDEGVHYAKVFGNILEDYQSTQESARQKTRERARSLTIAFSERIAASGELLTAVNWFRSEYPAVHISGSQGDTISTIKQGNADIALILTNRPVYGTEFNTAYIAREKEKLIVSDWVEGVGDQLDPGCWNATYIQERPSESTNTEAQIILSQKVKHLGLMPRHIDVVPNLKSLMSTLQFSPCVTVSGTRFGFLAASNMRSFEIPAALPTLWLSCIWSKYSENIIVPRFVEFMQKHFA